LSVDIENLATTREVSRVVATLFTENTGDASVAERFTTGWVAVTPTASRRLVAASRHPPGGIGGTIGHIGEDSRP
jgi:hypothetical protein